MLSDNKLEELAATAKKIYKPGMRMSDFIEKMDEEHYNTPHYIYRVIFITACEFKG